MYLSLIMILFYSFLIQGLFGRYCGKKGSAIISIGCIMIATIMGGNAMYEVGLTGSNYRLKITEWINIGTIKVEWGIGCESMNVIMILVVLIIATLVHIYSYEYMKEDAHSIRFMGYLTLFTFFMIELIMGDNLIQLFMGWEGVGLVSYLLINYWYTRVEANRSAIKAMIVNRVGDYGLGLSIIIIYFVYRSVDIGVVMSLSEEMEYYIGIGGYKVNGLTLIGSLIFIGAIGKSAQIGLNTWLPDAMEGPTPVSALIHAATMVTAGVFVLIRCSTIMEQAPILKVVVMSIGGITAIFAGTTGIYQNDIKRVIAFSTCSQLGYMIVACGLSAYSVALFHLVNHAFFKALLFLGAGSIIHGFGDEQDMRKMGGIAKVMPISYITMLIGSFALIGVPFLAGFYSKEIIIELGLIGYTIDRELVGYLCILSGFCTAWYSLRLMKLVFFGETRAAKQVIANIRESRICMTLPLIILGVTSIIIGYIGQELFIGMGTDYFKDILYINVNSTRILETEFLDSIYKLIPIVSALIGLIVGLRIRVQLKWYVLSTVGQKIQQIKYIIYIFLNKKWYLDILYNEFIAQPVLVWSYKTGLKELDRGLIAIMGASGMVRVLKKMGVFLTKLHSGYIYQYGLMIIGAMMLLSNIKSILRVEGLILIVLYGLVQSMNKKSKGEKIK
jgi:NADH-ubiquinone oxidoreductase chain 5